MEVFKMKQEKNDSAELASDFDDKKPWDLFYGNGRVLFVARGTRMIELNGANFDVERSDQNSGSHGEYWIVSETVVALGGDVSRKQAVIALKKVIDTLEDGAPPKYWKDALKRNVFPESGNSKSAGIFNENVESNGKSSVAFLRDKKMASDDTQSSEALVCRPLGEGVS